MKIKIISSTFADEFEKEINNFILNHNIKDIKFEMEGTTYTAMIIYEDKIAFDSEPKTIQSHPFQIKCPKCGKAMNIKYDIVYIGKPPKYKYVCDECGHEEIK